MTKCPAIIKYEARIWDKREHWHFDVIAYGKDLAEAQSQLESMYPAKRYSIGSLYKVW